MNRLEQLKIRMEKRQNNEIIGWVSDYYNGKKKGWKRAIRKKDLIK